MKKNLNKIMIVVLNLFIIVSIFSVNDVLASEEYVTEYASYKEDQKLIEQNIGYGIEHIKTTAITSTKNCVNPNGYGIENSPQVVNVLSVPSNETIKIVNYTFPNPTGWTKQTLSKIANNFELNNPGWTVLAGINGDFYDMSAADKALPYQTRGTTVSNGELLRAEEAKSIGYTNDGSSISLKYTERIEFTDYHILSIYDEFENVIKEIKIDKINELPAEGEISVYFSYRQNIDNDNDGKPDTSEFIEKTIPRENSFLIESAIRCLPTSEPEIYGKGKISSINESKALKFGEFGIVINNKEIQTLLSENTLIRIQKQVIGELANCDQIMNVGSTLMEDGIVSRDNSDGMREERHPRTCVGMKEDGTMMFFVIDGRQQSQNMYGMTQDEQGAMLAYYGCTLGFNVDGGGSSTFGIRDEYGNFKIMNAPCDNEERRVSNVLLITVPNLRLQKSNITDTSIKLSYEKLAADISINNLKITLNGITKDMDSNELIFDGLTPETEYELNYNYDITYKGNSMNIKGDKFIFKTGKCSPIVEKSYFTVNDDIIKLYFNIKDINNLSSFICLEFNGGLEFIDYPGEYTFEYNISECKKLDFQVEIDYSVECIPNRNDKISVYLKWQPNNLKLELYDEQGLNEINQQINNVNNQLKDLSTEEALILINNANTEIDKILTIDEKIDLYKKEKISIVEKLLENKNYSKKNLKKANDIINKAINKIKQASDKKEIDNIILETENLIINIEEKSCKSSTIIIYSFLISVSTVIIILNKKY